MWEKNPKTTKLNSETIKLKWDTAVYKQSE